MKKITKILSLTVVVASMMTPLALLANNSNGVNVKQEVNEIGSDSTVDLNKLDNIIEVNNQAIDVNSTIDNYQTVGDIISSDNCTAEDSGQTTTAWMGITNDFVNFIISKDYVSESQFGEVKITSSGFGKSITSTYLKIPNYIIFDSKKYSTTTIGAFAFQDCVGLKGPLTIPDSVTSIGEVAFRNCSHLMGTLIIPTSVTLIQSGAFENCTGLTSLDLTKATSLTTISASAFAECTGLTGPLIIPASVIQIDDHAFMDCTGLTSLDLSKATNLTSIRDLSFNGCVGLSGTLTIPANVTSIGNNAFSSCDGLTGLDLSKATSLTSIDNNAFLGCDGLSGTLTIPASVTTIGSDAFSFCTGLTSLDLSSATLIVTLIGFGFCTGLTALTIPASVTSIGPYAFYNCTGLTSLDLSNATNLTTIGDYAFDDCTGLTNTLTIPASVKTIESSAFENCNNIESLDLTKAKSLTTIGASAFQNCTSLFGPLTIPASVTSIGNLAFSNCSGISGSLTIPASVTSIGDNAFQNCSGLTDTLIISASVNSIGNEAFLNTNFKESYFLSQTPPATLGTRIFGTDVTKTLWVPNAEAKVSYEPFVQSNFGLLDASYIKVSVIAPTSVDITNLNRSYTINLNETNKPIATAIADIKPINTANKNVTWSLENEPSWLKIDVDGNIFADDDLKNVSPGKFTFKVKAECQADSTVSNITNDIELNVTYAPITSLAIGDIAAQNIELGESAKDLVKCNPITDPTSGMVPNAITWSLVNNNFDWLTIDQSTGQISTTKQITDASLTSVNLTVKAETTATVDGTKLEATKDFTINFIKPEPTGVEILNLNTTGYTTKAGAKFEIQLDWKVTPDYAKTEVTWDVTGPAGMAIDANGKITYSPTQILPETNFTVTCTSKTSSVTTQLTSKIEVILADVESIIIADIGTFDLVLGQDNPSLVTCTATVNPNPGTIQDVTWSIENKPSWINIESTTGVVSIKDAIDPILANNQQTIILKATSNQDTTKSATKDFIIYFVNPKLAPVEIIIASSSGAAAILGIAASTTTILIRKRKNKNVKEIHII